MDGTSIVVEPYYPEWDREREYFRVTRIKHGYSLILEDGFGDRAEAWQWYDGNKFIIDVTRG